MRPTKNSKSRSLREISADKQSVRPGFVLGAVLIVLLVTVLAVKLRKSSHFKAPPPVMPVLSASQDDNFSPLKPAPLPGPVVASASPAPARAVAVPPVVIAPEFLTASQLVDELAKIGSGPVTAEQAARFKQDLKELIHRGAASVPAIQGLLQQNIDVSYGDIQGGNQLGYSSLRASMIDALNQIGGPAAQSAMLAAMNTTSVPSELLQLAQDLDRQAPGQYRDQIVDGAQQTLALAASGQLGTNAEVGPAFRALQNYGGANAPADPATSDPLNFSAAVQLANQPDGQGLSALLQMAQNSTGTSQAAATAMIAQMAGQNGDAQTALIQMAQNGQISPNQWAQLAPILGGAQYQMDSSGQNYTLAGGATSADQIAQQVNLIEAMMNYVPAGTGGAKALQQQLSTLNGQMGSN
jgi:hypothetical protein